MIRVNNLCLELGSKAILQRVSLDIKAGKKLAVLGANGAGKSTLLKCITQEENRYRGDIYLSDNDIRQYPAAERARIMGV
ncbi:MAG: ATP-binding cassette domain-containing protein, partial [Pseudomonadota bacterium]